MIHGNQVFGAKDQASAFNRFFQSVYNNRNDGVLSCDFKCSTRMALDIVPTPAAVECILSNLDLKRACGGDGIPNCILKGLAKHLAPSVRTIIYKMIQLGRFPTEWKKGIISPIFKSGNKQLFTNYRPVTLLPCVSKAVERHFYNIIYPTIAPKISSNQYGFRKGLSCVLLLLVYLHRI